MWHALMWGGVSGSAVLVGALAALFLPIQKRIIGYIMAFGTGVLIGAALGLFVSLLLNEL